MAPHRSSSPAARAEPASPPAWGAGREVLRDRGEVGPAYPLVSVDVFDQSFQHQQDLWPPGHVRVDGDGERGVVEFTVHPVELVPPYLLQVSRVHEAVTVRACLDVQHWWQVVEV